MRISPDGIINFIDATTLEILDINATPENLSGKHFSEFVNDHSNELSFLKNIISEASPHSFQYALETLEGNEKWLFCDAFSVNDVNSETYFHALIKDITSITAADKTLVDTEKRYKLLAENISDVIWSMDVNLKFSFVSPSVETLLGYSPEEFLQLSIEKLFTLLEL